jgi:hypothetical protein
MSTFGVLRQRWFYTNALGKRTQDLTEDGLFHVGLVGWSLAPSSVVADETPYHSGTHYRFSRTAAREVELRLGTITDDMSEFELLTGSLAEVLDPEINNSELFGTKDKLGYLECERASGGTRRLDCVYRSGLESIDAGIEEILSSRISLVFYAPDPRWYSPSLTTVPVTPQSLAYPSDAGFNVPGSGPEGTFLLQGRSWGNPFTITNSGSAPTEPSIEVLGPVKNPSLYNLTINKAVKLFVDVPETGKITVDMREGQVQMEAYGSVYPITRISNDTDFWALRPGLNVLLLAADEPKSVGNATISWYVRDNTLQRG